MEMLVFYFTTEVLFNMMNSKWIMSFRIPQENTSEFLVYEVMSVLLSRLYDIVFT